MLLEVSEFVFAVGSAISFLEDVFQGLVDTIFDASNWLVSGFLYVMIFLSGVFLVLSFLWEFSEMFGEHEIKVMKENKRQAEYERRRKERQAEYEKRYHERRAAAEKRYRERYSQSRPWQGPSRSPSYDIQKAIREASELPVYTRKRPKVKVSDQNDI